jgi:hypothetical protein
MAPPITDTLVRVGKLYKDTRKSAVYFDWADFANANDAYRYVLNSRVANDKFLYDILTSTQKTYLYSKIGVSADIDLVTML